jgi:hypothetical protein
MKITKKILENIIKEEIKNILSENEESSYKTGKSMTGKNATSMAFYPSEATHNELALYKRSALVHKASLKMANELDQRITKIEDALYNEKEQPVAAAVGQDKLD